MAEPATLPSMPNEDVRISAGVPAYNTGPRLREAVESLLHQELPAGTRWSRLWIVVSGCTDDTLEVAESLALKDARVAVVRQATREGKASALREIFARAEGEYLVLLNGDATALPGAVRALLASAEGQPGNFAIMGRPMVHPDRTHGIGHALEILWDLHHRLHQKTLTAQEGNHLSDELWLLPIPVRVPFPSGVVNDGAYLGAWLRGHGGRILYAPTAHVMLETPRTLGEHLRQRRRIHWGHRQIAALLGVEPTTWKSYAKRHPAAATREILGCAREHPMGIPWTALLALIEVQAFLLAGWDRHVGGKNHVLWDIVAPARAPQRSPSLGARSSDAAHGASSEFA